MIANEAEYLAAQDELRSMESWLLQLQQSYPGGSKGYTKAGVRKMIARLQEELAVYEGNKAAREPIPR